MQKLLQEYIRLEISKILLEGFYENPMTTIQDILNSFSGRTLIFFDTETTGLSGTNSFSQITEIAAVVFDDKAKKIGQYHYKTKLNPAVLTKINQEKNKKTEQRILDLRIEEIKQYKEDLIKLKKILENISSVIFEKITSSNVQNSLEKLRKKLFVKTIDLINNKEKNISKTKLKESSEFNIQIEIENIISDYKKLTNLLNSISYDNPLETEKKISKEIKNFLKKFQSFIMEIKPEKNEWDWKWKSIEDILDMTQYYESNAEITTEKNALEGFKSFIYSFTNPLLIAHNASFDMMQINNGLHRYNLKYISKNIPILDTVKLFENYIKPLLRILKGGNPTEKIKRLIVALSFQAKDIKQMDVQQYKEFIDKQNIEEIYKNVNRLYSSLKHLSVGLNVELNNWHSAVADAEALSKVLLILSKIMYKYKHFENQFELQRKRANELGYQRKRKIEKSKIKKVISNEG